MEANIFQQSLGGAAVAVAEAVDGKKWTIIFGQKEKEKKRLGLNWKKRTWPLVSGGSYDRSEMSLISRILLCVKKRSPTGSF